MQVLRPGNAVLTGIGGSVTEGAYGNTYAPDKGDTGSSPQGAVIRINGDMPAHIGDASAASPLPEHITPPAAPTGRG